MPLRSSQSEGRPSSKPRIGVTYKAVRSLSIQDAAYIAGLIDGEGTVTLTRRHVNERRQLS
jgi:hypothetical protein